MISSKVSHIHTSSKQAAQSSTASRKRWNMRGFIFISHFSNFTYSRYFYALYEQQQQQQYEKAAPTHIHNQYIHIKFCVCMLNMLNGNGKIYKMWCVLSFYMFCVVLLSFAFLLSLPACCLLFHIRRCRCHHCRHSTFFLSFSRWYIFYDE